MVFRSEDMLLHSWRTATSGGFVLHKRSINSCQFQCTCHFTNNHGDCDDHHHYFSSWYNGQRNEGDHIFFGCDPCAEVTRDDGFTRYGEVWVEFVFQHMDGHLLPDVNVIDFKV